MSKPPLRFAAGRRGPTVRHTRHESIGHVIRSLQEAGPDAVHTVRSIAALMYGDDCIVETRHLSAARRMIDKIEKLQLPLEPCDETGVLISKASAKARARSGMLGRWRYDPVGNALGEAILEGMGHKPFVTAAIAVLTLESATVTSPGGAREVKAFFDAVRGWIPKSAFQAAEQQLVARCRPRAGGR